MLALHSKTQEKKKEKNYHSGFFLTEVGWIDPL